MNSLCNMNVRRSKILFSLLCLVCLVQNFHAQTTMEEKIIIAHRGASGYLPEHTLEAKALAYGLGSDYLEQDIVLTQDDVPIVMHDIYLDEVTNVNTIFPDRARSDGRYYVIDFSFVDLQKLNVHERINRTTGKQVYPERFPKSSSSFSIHSLQEEIEMVQGMNHSTGKNVGIYPEIKNPKFHQSEGKDISKIVLDILKDYGYSTKDDACILQCFDAKELKRIRLDLGSQLFLTQLMEAKSEIVELEAFANYADAIGPWYGLFIDRLDQKGEPVLNDLSEKAHDLGLKVHPYTYRKDDHEGFKSFEDLLNVSFQQLGVDGVFTDFPDIVARYLNRSKR